jgi:ribosomal protein L37E
MGGGIVFTGTVTGLRDQFGYLVICSRCGGDTFDVTLRPGQADRLECSAPDCGAPVTADDVTDLAEAGR